MAGKRRNCSAEFEAKAALEAIRGEVTVAGPVAKRGVHRAPIDTSKRQALAGMSGIFRARPRRRPSGRRARSRSCTPGSASLGETAIFQPKPPADERPGRRETIGARHPALSITRHCALTGISRSAWHGPGKGESPPNLALTKLIDAQFEETPFHGSRRMARHLRNRGHCGPAADGPDGSAGRQPAAAHDCASPGAPQVSVSAPGSADRPAEPGLVRGYRLHSDAAVAIMGWATRRVLARRLSNTMDAEFRIEAPDDALRLRATGFDTDQGSQFTSPWFTQALPDAAVKVWVDSRALDGQRYDRAAMAVPETRMRLPARLRHRVRGTGGHRQVDRRSHHRAPTFRARRDR